MSQKPVALPCLGDGPEKGFDGSFPDNGSNMPAVDDVGRLFFGEQVSLFFVEFVKGTFRVLGRQMCDLRSSLVEVFDYKQVVFAVEQCGTRELLSPNPFRLNGDYDRFRPGIFLEWMR